MPSQITRTYQEQLGRAASPIGHDVGGFTERKTTPYVNPKMRQEDRVDSMINRLKQHKVETEQSMLISPSMGLTRDEQQYMGMNSMERTHLERTYETRRNTEGILASADDTLTLP